MKIGVTYAVYVTNRALLDYAIETLSSITSRKHSLVFSGLLNHSLEPGPRAALQDFGELVDNDENCLSRAWNRGIDRLLKQGCRYVFVPNLDIVLADGALDNLVDEAKTNRKPILWTMAPWHDLESIDQADTTPGWLPYPHFSAFMVDKRLFRDVGPFDERFKPAYNEDLDMHWRIKMAGHEAGYTTRARFFHHGSVTIRNDPELNMTNSQTHGTNDNYFREKWNDKPATADEPFTDKMFRYPFNDPDLAGMEHAYEETW